MSSPPPETETYDIELSRDEQWVAHHALVHRVDTALDDDESPPSWTIEVLEAIESGDADESETLTGYQARRLHDVVTDYVDRTEASADIEHGSTVVDRLEATLELS